VFKSANEKERIFYLHKQRQEGVIDGTEPLAKGVREKEGKGEKEKGGRHNLEEGG